mmetsp:Transcript_3039/g.5396  ORF Transcript_3039/g.5396 Transcript_3039/m.5396 type:complete len:159 (-) Transcript_3039:191-667(-)|eukprot:CAMPEP_0197448552 /NCGR_PEP_ID=MMETSP1175-20131217/18041_1 /TAXON_ID=1003142 /ORGANISM="Triceratium dubium, Strain CCMP147" /LENGTH=158 /DNA_ID=CAMNT_0042980353 /DNA_START=57 /DNA_END=533 /DNA_ORIENTATION=+
MSKGERIIVPARVVNGGFDTKFESDPYGVNLRGLLTPEQYTDAITRINDDIRSSRSSGVDTALLVTGPLIVPLAVWGARHSVQTKKRKRLLKKSIDSFNGAYPDLLMRWNRRPESCLTIERRTADHGAAPPRAVVNSVTGGIVGGVKEDAIGEEDVYV